MKNNIVAENNLYENPNFPFAIFSISEDECIPPGPSYHYLHWYEDLHNFYSSSEVYAKEYETALRLQHIWLEFIRNVKDCIQISSKTFLLKQEYMQTLLTFIHENYMMEISLKNISESAHISQAECCRLFKNLLHTSPYEYLITYRINKSIDLLKETNMPITEIATKVGFNDSRHFIQLFKKHTSKTPKKYRNSNKSSYS